MGEEFSLKTSTKLTTLATSTMKEGPGKLYRVCDDSLIYEGNFHLGKPLGKGTYYFYEPRLY